jgi:hypothetical protein
MSSDNTNEGGMDGGCRQEYLECPKLLSCGGGMTAAAATVADGGMSERSGTSAEGDGGGFNAVRPSGCGRPTANGLMGLQLMCGRTSGLV